MEQGISNTPASKVRRPTSVGSVRWVGWARWVSERLTTLGGPRLGEVGEVGEVGDTDIQTADTASYLAR